MEEALIPLHWPSVMQFFSKQQSYCIISLYSDH